MLEPWDLSVTDVENLRVHYAATLEHWRHGPKSAAGDVTAMFDDAFVRAWRLYLADRRRRSPPDRCTLSGGIRARRQQRVALDAIRLIGRDEAAVTNCDVLIVGGGPAGSACAWRLRQAGLSVIVVDASTFPRDKVCAGWITPQAMTALGLDTTAYADGRTLQPFTGFHVGLIGGDVTRIAYDRPVSFGIRRCEFDHYLLQRADVRLALGVRIASMRRDGGNWIVNDTFRAPLLVGAGGWGVQSHG